MVLNPFLKLESWSLGADFNPIITSQCIKLDKGRKNVRNKNNFINTKRFNSFFLKNGFNPVLGSIQRPPLKSHLVRL